MLYQKLIERKEKLAVIGLGYVGMPIAIEFAKKIDVVGFDIDINKIENYKNGIDPTNEVGNDVIRHTNVHFTCNKKILEDAKFFIIAVPTPINNDKTPNLVPIISASKIVGKVIKPGAIVVYESTVYPGVTETVCVDILEKESGLICGTDFKIGYSPERINPGDKTHRLNNIKKIVSGMDEESLAEISKIYELVVEVGVHRATSIKVAEAAKVVENSQRDINIAFMNELAIVFDRMGIDTFEVIEAMNTKWNALRFYPGLVGGHCIGVDPYYFIYEAEKLGYHSQIILSGRKINDDMSRFIADATIKKMIQAGKKVKDAKVGIFGITFKENCPDTRNSKVLDIIIRLKEYCIKPVIFDPVAEHSNDLQKQGLDVLEVSEAKDLDCAIFAVAHDEFKQCAENFRIIDSAFSCIPNNEKVIIDVKGIFDRRKMIEKGYSYWRL